MTKLNRIPNENLYDNVYTLVLAFSILWLIFFVSPTNHCSLYFIKNKLSNPALLTSAFIFASGISVLFNGLNTFKRVTKFPVNIILPSI